MRAVVCDRLGDPSVLKIEDVPIPEIGPADVLIKVGAASVNFPDVLMLIGGLPAQAASCRSFPAWKARARSRPSAPT